MLPPELVRPRELSRRRRLRIGRLLLTQRGVLRHLLGVLLPEAYRPMRRPERRLPVRWAEVARVRVFASRRKLGVRRGLRLRGLSARTPRSPGHCSAAAPRPRSASCVRRRRSRRADREGDDRDVTEHAGEIGRLPLPRNDGVESVIARTHHLVARNARTPCRWRARRPQTPAGPPTGDPPNRFPEADRGYRGDRPRIASGSHRSW